MRESITSFEVDGVINAANETLLGGGGVDRAIHNAAGPNLIRECAFHNGCKTGEAVMTKGYDLPAKLHTVGPILNESGQENTKALRQCYESCLQLCDQYDLRSLAVPCVACGFYGFPVHKSAVVVKTTIQDYIDKTYPTVKDIILAVPQHQEWMAYLSAFQETALSS